MDKVFYYIPSDMAIIPMDDGKVLFRSDNLAIRLEGASVAYLIEQIFPALDGKSNLRDVAVRKNISAGELKTHLDNLVHIGVLKASDYPIGEEQLHTGAFKSLLAKLHLDPLKTADYFKQTKIVVAGLEGAGSLLAMQLLQVGITTLTLIDPFPLQKEELILHPFLSEKSIGKKRQDVFKAYLDSIFPEVNIHLGPDTLTRETVYAAAQDSNFIAGCFDKGFISVHHWLNQVAMEKMIPAIFSEIENHICRIGPLVLPGETACFMCYRMRDIATAENFAEEMGYETFLNNQKKPILYARGFLPSSINYVAGIISNEIIKLLLTIEISLSGRVLEFNALELEARKHHVLQKPDCPVCFKKKAWERSHFSLEELNTRAKTESNIYSFKKKLVSAKTGVIKQFELLPKSPTEPPVPYTISVTLSNHSYFPKEQGDNETCSGKGLTLQAAEISALGEGVERYSGGCFRKDEIHFSTYNELQGLKLDPQKLVLYQPEQYSALEFSAFNPAIPIGWSKAYSLVNSCMIEVPSIAVFMNYSVASPAEYICSVTSNGLAAGATLSNAILSAALEVIERDAFLVAWYNELACQRIDPLTHPQKEIVNYCESYMRRGVEMQLYRLPTDFPVHVFMGVGYQLSDDEGPAMVVGLGADFDPAKAAAGALLEIGQVRPALKQRLKSPETKQRLAELLANPSHVKTLEDHSLLYASKKAAHAFQFLFQRPFENFDWLIERQDTEKNLQTLVDFLRSKQSDLIYYNLTPPDMEALGLYTARVIIPDMQPIHFGETNIRLGGTRLYHLPQQLGLKQKAVRPDELNKNPHPLA